MNLDTAEAISDAGSLDVERIRADFVVRADQRQPAGVSG